LYVSPSRGTYKCFGCGNGGDIISFVEAIEGLTFREALVRLADRAGIELVNEKKSAEDYRKILLIQINESAKEWFVKNLNEDSRARTYLMSRGLHPKTIQLFSVGVAPKGWDGLVTHLRHEGYQDADIVDAGLAIEGNKGIYDRFRSRIMFPIRNGVGKTVAFTGRVIPGMETEKDAKYVNSPETPIYSKSNILFGYDMAKSTLLREGRVVLVEGQMDLLMAHQVGTEGIVAISGTALTESHIALLKRFTDNLVFSLDADSAGVKASQRSIDLALSLGMNVEMILIPSGKDPADIIQESPEHWKKIVADRKHIIDFLLYVFAHPQKEERERIREVTTHVLPAIASVPNALEEAHFIKKVAEALKMEESTIRKEVEKIRMQKTIVHAPVEKTTSTIENKKRYQRIEDELLCYLSINNENTKDIQREYERIRGKTYEEILNILDEEKKESLLFKRDVQWKDGPPSLAYAQELLYEFEKAFLEEKLKRTTRLLRQAEKEKNKSIIEKYLLESQDLLATIHRLVAPNTTQ